MAGGAETPNIAALPAIARLGACESARGPDADRRVKLLIQFAVEGSLSGAYSHPDVRRPQHERTADIRQRDGHVRKVPLPDSCTAANKNPYSITSSATASDDTGALMPSVLAVLRLM
jgi:hypothetical protein